MYTAIDLSKYIVSKCFNENCPITNLHLQKILYYIQREFLKRHNHCAFPDKIEAWQFGPVIPNVYYKFCGFGAMPISTNYNNYETVCSNDLSIIDDIVTSKRIMNPWDLVEDTHKPNGAWAMTYREGLGNHTEIPTDLIRTVG